MTCENWPNITRSHGCSCRSCRGRDRLIDRLADRSLSVALRHAQDRSESSGFAFEAATPAGTVTLPGTFSGWRGAITLGELFGPAPPLPFQTRGKPGPNGPGRLYRIYQENKQRPLYIGMAFEASIQSRVASHFVSVMTKAGTLAKTRQVLNLAASGSGAANTDWRSEIAKLRALTAAAGMNATIRVQHGEVTPVAGGTMDAKLLHAFESALQVIERPHSYVGAVRTFETEWS